MDEALSDAPRPPRWQAFLDRALREREIILRSDDRIRFIRLTRRTQKLLLVPVGTAIALVALLAGGFISKDVGIQVKEDELARARAQYLALLSEAVDFQEQSSRVTRDLETNQKLLLGLVEGQGGRRGAGSVAELKSAEVERGHVALLREAMRRRLDDFAATLPAEAEDRTQIEAKIAGLKVRLDSAGDELGIMLASRDGLATKVQELRSSVARLEQEEGRLKGSLAAQRQEIDLIRSDRDSLKTARADLTRRLEETAEKLEATERQARRVKSELDETEAELATATREHEATAAERDRIRKAMEEAERRRAAIAKAQNGLVERLAERTQRLNDGLEREIARTGIGPRQLADIGEDRKGQGGPFIAAVNNADLPEDAEKALLRLEAELGRRDLLEKVTAALPLMSPAPNAALSSGFGKRVDPINGRLAMHEGLDFKADVGTPVLAPQPGKVVFTGWRGNYGRTIEIDHGMGIVTRFAHLSRIEVSEGDSVGMLERIGRIGSSGRSTGAHLHYEILVAGTPLDPMRFLKAGRHVQQND